jgi:hypothetical protein
MVNQKILERNPENIYYKHEEYVVPQEESSEDTGSNEFSFLSPPSIQRRPSVYNKLKNIAENPEKLKEKIHGSPQKRLNLTFDMPDDNFSLGPNASTLGHIQGLMKKNSGKSVIQETDERSSSKESSESLKSFSVGEKTKKKETVQRDSFVIKMKKIESERKEKDSRK